MRTLVSILAIATILGACAPQPKQPPAGKTYHVCVVDGKHFIGDALVTLKGEDERILYSFEFGGNGEYTFRPHDGTDEGMPKTHHAFVALSPFDPNKVSRRSGNGNCQNIVGLEVIDDD